MDEFIVVKHRRKKHAKRLVAKETAEGYTGISPNELCQKIKLAKCHICTTPFYQQFLRIMESGCVDGHHVYFGEVCCYGIGHIGMCQSALHQVALLMAIVEEWKPLHAWIFDPVLYAEEIKALKALGLEIIPRNEACRRTVEVKTLFFMPHCGKAMYNNLLWANWNKDNLHNITIIGNAFSSYTMRLTTTKLQEEAWYIHSILPYCCELPLPSSFPFPNTLNDTSIHMFPMQNLAQVPISVWTNCLQPLADPTDPEIVL